jgi:protease I
LTLIEGDLVSGRTVTSWPSICTDLCNARARWVDEPVVVCRNGINTLVTGRGPADLNTFCDVITDTFSQERAVA